MNYLPVTLLLLSVAGCQLVDSEPTIPSESADAQALAPDTLQANVYRFGTPPGVPQRLLEPGVGAWESSGLVGIQMLSASDAPTWQEAERDLLDLVASPPDGADVPVWLLEQMATATLVFRPDFPESLDSSGDDQAAARRHLDVLLDNRYGDPVAALALIEALGPSLNRGQQRSAARRALAAADRYERQERDFAISAVTTACPECGPEAVEEALRTVEGSVGGRNHRAREWNRARTDLRELAE